MFIKLMSYYLVFVVYLLVDISIEVDFVTRIKSRLHINNKFVMNFLFFIYKEVLPYFLLCYSICYQKCFM